MNERVTDYFKSLQDQICRAFEIEDGKSQFREDLWEKPKGGGGRTRIMSEGNVFERAGVNFSRVYGDCLPASASQKHPELNGAPFQAQGISLVVHPKNPFVPTTHANLRFFTAKVAPNTILWWFGGGYDLTPYYGFEDDCRHWHLTAKAACDPYGRDIYVQFKKACDDYFYIKHRLEPRGIGGLFFDDLNHWGFERCFSFIQSVGDSFLKAYLPIVQRRKDQPYGDRERQFQLYRRGRYVEFNLIYDRGTLFGLQFGGRIESILMSLPPLVSWKYQHNPESGSEEERLCKEFLITRNWIE